MKNRPVLVFLFAILACLSAAPVSAQETFTLWPRHFDYGGKCIDHVLEQFGTSKNVYSGYTFRLKAPDAFKVFVERGGRVNLYLNSTNFHVDQWKESWPVPEIKDRWCVRADPSKPHGPGNRVYYKDKRVLFDIRSPSFQRWAAKWTVKLSAHYSGISFDNVLIGDARIKAITADNPGWEYAGIEDEWNIAMIRYLAIVQQTLTANGKRLCVNTTLDLDSDNRWWNALVLGAKVDTILTEKYPGKNEAASLARAQWIMDSGTNLWVALYDHNSIGDVASIAAVNDSKLRVSVFLRDSKKDISGVVGVVERAIR